MSDFFVSQKLIFMTNLLLDSELFGICELFYMPGEAKVMSSSRFLSG